MGRVVAADITAWDRPSVVIDAEHLDSFAAGMVSLLRFPHLDIAPVVPDLAEVFGIGNNNHIANQSEPFVLDLFLKRNARKCGSQVVHLVMYRRLSVFLIFVEIQLALE